MVSLHTTPYRGWQLPPHEFANQTITYVFLLHPCFSICLHQCRRVYSEVTAYALQPELQHTMAHGHHTFMRTEQRLPLIFRPRRRSSSIVNRLAAADCLLNASALAVRAFSHYLRHHRRLPICRFRAFANLPYLNLQLLDLSHPHRRSCLYVLYPFGICAAVVDLLIYIACLMAMHET